MIEAVRAAAAEVACGKPLTKTAYDAYQREHGGPSGIWLIRHFGTWRGAVLSAGLPANARMGRRAQYSDGDLADAVASYLASPGATGTYAGYEELGRGRAAARAGRPCVPASAPGTPLASAPPPLAPAMTS